MISNQTPADDNRTMTIGELSEVTGLSVSAIRFYQRRGLLPERGGEGGWQRFGREALDRLAVIELAKSAGFTLDEVVRILDAFDVDPDAVPAGTPVWQGLASVKIADIDDRVRRLTQMRQLLRDALDVSYLSADSARQIPAMLGWRTGDDDPARQKVTLQHRGHLANAINQQQAGARNNVTQA